MTKWKWAKKPSNQIRVGLVFLILASLTKWFTQSDNRFPEGWTDGVTGFLYGVSIAFMLLGIWRATHRSGGQTNG